MKMYFFVGMMAFALLTAACAHTNKANLLENEGQKSDNKKEVENLSEPMRGEFRRFHYMRDF